MPKFASTGLLAFTGGLAGAGTGLSNAAQQYAKHVADKDIESLRNEYDIKKVQLADQLGGIRDAAKFKHDAEQGDLNRANALQAAQLRADTDLTITDKNVAGTKDVTGMKNESAESIVDKEIGSKENMFGQDIALRKEMAANQLSLGREQIAASRDASQLQAGVQVTLQGMQNSNMTDRQITEHIQRDKEQGVKGAQEMAVLHEQAVESRRNLQAEYNLKTLMTRQEFLNALDLAKENNKAAMDRTMAGEKGATDRANIASDTSRANAQTASGAEIVTTAMRADSAKILKAMDQGEVKDFLVDQSGQVFSVDKLGKPSATPIMNDNGKPIIMSGDKGKQDKALIGAVLDSVNGLQKEAQLATEQGDIEKADRINKIIAHREELFQRIAGVRIGNEPFKDKPPYASSVDGGEDSASPGLTGIPAPKKERGVFDYMKAALPGNAGMLYQPD